MQAYSNPERENDKYALPDIEVFYQNEWLNDDGTMTEQGFYYWYCFPGCLPDSEPIGPFDTEQEAIDDAREDF